MPSPKRGLHESLLTRALERELEKLQNCLKSE